jgi:hypothetical protein
MRCAGVLTLSANATAKRPLGTEPGGHTIVGYVERWVSSFLLGGRSSQAHAPPQFLQSCLKKSPALPRRVVSRTERIGVSHTG